MSNPISIEVVPQTTELAEKIGNVPPKIKISRLVDSFGAPADNARVWTLVSKYPWELRRQSIPKLAKVDHQVGCFASLGLPQGIVNDRDFVA